MKIIMLFNIKTVKNFIINLIYIIYEIFDFNAFYVDRII